MNRVKRCLSLASNLFYLFLLSFVVPLHAQVDNGLVAYFPLDNNGLDLISGASGTVYGATSAENRWGDSGKAYSFDGTDDYIEVPFQSTYSTDEFSFSLWVKPTATSSQHSSPLTFRGNQTGHILYKTPQNAWAAWVGTGGSWAENVLGSIEVGNWQFIASTYSADSYRGYVDGDLVATISPSFSKNTSAPLRIGAGKTEGSPDFFFAGVVDEVRLYNRALSQNEVKQLQIIDHPSFKDVSGLGYTYVDENQSTQGPWALLGYGSNGALPGKLTTASGQMDEARQGSAVLNALSFLQSAPKVAITWTNNGSAKPNGGILSYDHGVAFEFPNPSALTLTAGQTPSAGAGLSNWSTISTDASTISVDLETLVGTPGLPSSMYARRETFGAMYGNAYGFASSSINAQLDWTVDGQAFNVLYLGLNGNNGYVAPGGGGSGNGYIPSTMAIWGQLESPPVNLHAVGALSITENSSVGTVAGEFNATDLNGDTITYSLMPALPSNFSPVLWLDANDSSTVIQSSGAVSTWQDKSGNNYHFTQESDTSRRPLYSATSLNGMPAITFDGSNDYLSISSRLGFSANPDISVFAVTTFISNIATDNRIFQLGNNAHSLAVAGGSGSWSWRFNGGNEVYNPVSLNTAAQQAWVRHAGSNYQASQFFYNGSEQTRVIGASDTTVPSDTAAVSFVGAGASGGGWVQNLSANVKISELVVLSDTSDASRRGIETYLARKWGLTYIQPTSDGVFELDTNGTLKSLVSLDRETVASLPITVRATDSNGNFIEEEFSVTVLDDGLEDTDGDGLSDAQERSGFSQYEQINGAYSWSAAKAEAESRGGHLATISDLAEQTAVESFVSGSVWLGGTDQVDEGNWTWVDGSPWTYANWSSVQAFSATGSDQSFVVPAGVTSLSVKIWGAGGGGGREGYRGGAGGYTEGNLTVTPGETLTIIVGQGGILHSGFPLDRDYRYGGGASGGGGDTYNLTFGSGGGRSAVRRGTLELATAGGGGGGGYADHGGNAGGANGLPVLGTLSSAYPHGGQTNNSGLGPGGTGGTHGQSGSESGVAGIQFKGGYSQGINGALTSEAGGGGGGYFGGGGGGDNRGGGGGSGYFGGLTNGATSGSAQGTLYPPNTTDPDYPSASNPSPGSGAVGAAGDGASTGNSTGGDGLIVLQWSPAHAPTSTNEDYLSIDSSRGGKWVPQPSSQNLGFLLEKTYVSDPNLSDSDGDGFADNLEYNAGSNPESKTSSPLEYGLTAWYPFDGNASDMSGNGRHGTTYNGAGWAAGKVGQALSLDGADDYMDAGDFEIGGAVTFAAWVKYDAFKHWSRVFDFGNGQDNNNILMANDGTSAASRFNIHLPSGNPSLPGTNLTLNNWLHRVGVIEANGNMRLYLNGSLVSSNANTSVLPTLTRTLQYVGRSNWSGDGYLDGLIDDFRIYNRALSATEVSNLHQLPNSDADGDGFSYSEEWEAGTNPNSSMSKPSLMDGLLLWYPLDGNTSDMSGNDRHASLSNANGTTSGFMDGKILKALDLDGVDDYLSVPHDSGLDLRRTLSLSIWLKLDAIPSTGYSAIMYKGGGNGGSSRTYSLWLENASRFIHATSADSTDQQSANSANSAFTNNSWMHLVMLLDRNNGTIRAFKDKVMVANSAVRSTNTVSSQNPLLFGKSQESNSDFSVINGQVDDIRLYDRVLYSFEIEKLYQLPSSDNDGDGFSYVHELIAGTNPDSNDSFPSEFLFGVAGATGRNGPTQAQIDAAYSGSVLKDKVVINTQGIQRWTIPFSGVYELEALGASGGRFNGNAGKGAALTGRFNLNASDVLNILVGQEGLVSGNRGGGGGGTFAWLDGASTPLIVAGGGGGNGQSDSNSMDANLSSSGTSDGGNHYLGGANGQGGAVGFGNSGGGGGWLTAGGGYGGEKVYQGSGVGGGSPATGGEGGFGGGGAGESDSSGGGGGYSGGSGGWYGAGGGGSFNAGTQSTASVRSDYGSGSFRITWLSSQSGNQAPTGLTKGGPLQTYENLPVGSSVGSFSAIDPDGDELSYSLVSGAGDTGNSYFALDTNGSLKTAVVFDYETNASTYSIRVQAKDPSNTTTEGNFTIYLLDVDDTAPVISLSGNAQVTHEAGTPYLDANASWSDAVDGSGVVYASGEVNASHPGLYELSYDYTDAAGNVAQTVTRTVNVVDTTAPVISLNGEANITHEAGFAYLDRNASWSDTVDGNGVVYASGEVNASHPGVYELSYDYTDAAGNVAQTVTRTIAVEDTTVPVISLNGDAQVTHEAGHVYFDANASWSDAVDGSGIVISVGEVNASTPGTYELTYDYVDGAGNAAARVVRLVTVVDSTAPVISLNGEANITHEAGFAYLELNASWTDAVDGSGVVYASGEVDTSVPGVYVLSYDYTDAAGNVAQTVTRWVEVINLAPEDLITSNESNLSILENETNGTLIGSFEASDRNPNSILTFSLEGVMDANSSQTEQDTHTSSSHYGNVFGLSSDGELVSLRPLDYEVDPKHFKILIRVTDQFGAFGERTFFVSVENVVEDFDQDGVEDHYDTDDDADGYDDMIELEYGFNPLDRWSYPNLPLVRTLEVTEENQTIIFGAEVLSFGGFEQANLGLHIYDETVSLIEEFSSSEFTENLYTHEVPLSRFTLGQKIRYQAYAENPTGRNFGPMLEHFIGGEYALSIWWVNDELLHGGWRSSTWLGTYLPNRENDWIYHLDLGWLYVQPDGLEGFWFWMPEEKWLWSKEDVWPFLWSDTSGGWLYPIYSSGKRYFYDYTQEKIR